MIQNSIKAIVGGERRKNMKKNGIFRFSTAFFKKLSVFLKKNVNISVVTLIFVHNFRKKYKNSCRIFVSKHLTQFFQEQLLKLNYLQ